MKIRVLLVEDQKIMQKYFASMVRGMKDLVGGRSERRRKAVSY